MGGAGQLPKSLQFEFQIRGGKMHRGLASVRQSLWRYFNGSQCLQSDDSQENLKRKGLRHRPSPPVYRAEIDGLRAVAVLPVILFHAGFPAFSGGFIGVDVFFVISGYLITTIIYGEIQNGSFSIVRFYERRIRRILPALFVVSVTCIPFAWLWMLPTEFKDFAQSLVAVNVFASNILFWAESGYFSAAVELKPLLHTWSLAIEEQFYVFFPLFLLLFRQFRQQALLVFLVMLVALSFAFAEWGSRTHPSANFYLLPTRAWELGLGAILAISADTWSRTEGWAAQVAATIGLGGILYAILAFDEALPFPGVWALIPVLGTALVIAYARPQTVVGRILGWRPIVGVGLISYSAYLWHQPLFAFARIRLLEDGISPAAYLGLSVLALVLAYVCWRFIEQPFRNKAAFSRRQVFSGATVVAASIIAFGLFGHLTAGAPNRFSPETIQIAAWAQHKNPRGHECSSGLDKFIKPEESCVYGDNNSPDVAIWGDSHATTLAHQLAKFLSTEQHGLRHLSYNGCAPVVGYRPSYQAGKCPQYNAAVQKFLLSHWSPDLIVLFSRWSLYMEGQRFNNREGGVESGEPNYALPLEGGRDFISDATRIDEIGRLYRASIHRLLESGKRVVLVYPAPEVGWNVPQRLAAESHYGIERQEPLSTSYEVFKQRARNTHEQLDMLVDHPNLVRIRPEEIFCDTFVPGRCIAQLDGKPLYLDADHLNSIGAAMLSKKIVEAMKERGWLYIRTVRSKG